MSAFSSCFLVNAVGRKKEWKETTRKADAVISSVGGMSHLQVSPRV